MSINPPPRFELNGFYERLLVLRSTDRKTFASLSRPTHWTLLEYEQQKRTQAELEARRNALPAADVRNKKL